MWEQLSAAIVSTMQNGSLTGVDSGAIYDYEPSLNNIYPAISVVPADAPAQFADTVRNQRTYTFSIKCLQERKEIGPNPAEEILRKLVDELIALFDTNHYLYGDFLHGRGFVQATPSRWAYVQTEQVDVRLAEILLACVVIQNP